MGKKSWSRSTMAQRTWRMLRLALLWVRKGGALRRRLAEELRFAPRRLKNRHCSDRLHYGEREFSIDDTPSFRFKLHGCNSSSYSFLYDFSNEDDDGEHVEEEESIVSGININLQSYSEVEENDNIGENGDEEEEEGIDVKAEEFIAKFYQQMKLQRQVSLLQYNEMLYRSMS